MKETMKNIRVMYCCNIYDLIFWSRKSVQAKKLSQAPFEEMINSLEKPKGSRLAR